MGATLYALSGDDRTGVMRPWLCDRRAEVNSVAGSEQGTRCVEEASPAMLYLIVYPHAHVCLSFLIFQEAWGNGPEGSALARLDG